MARNLNEGYLLTAHTSGCALSTGCRRYLLIFISALLFGCATASTSSEQSVFIQAIIDNKIARDVTCTLTNESGEWKAISFTSVKIRRSWGDLSIRCTNKDNSYGGKEVIRSVASSSMWASAGLLGPVALAVDSAAATGVDYPANIVIFLNKTTE